MREIRISESIINQNLFLELDQFLKKNNKQDLLVCGTRNMEGVPPNKTENILSAESDSIPFHLPDILL